MVVMVNEIIPAPPALATARAAAPAAAAELIVGL
jgi:hypothetical protein